MDKIGDELPMTANCIKTASSPGSRSSAAYYCGQNGGGSIGREHQHQHHHHHRRGPMHSASIVESHFLSPSSPLDSAASCRRHQHPLNGSAIRSAPMIPEPGVDVDDLMNDESDSASQSSRPGKSSSSSSFISRLAFQHNNGALLIYYYEP